MPYKDLERRRECRRRWYSNNKESEIKHIQRRKKEIRRWLEEYKSNLKCLKCSENHPATLEFHHESKKEKDNGISNMVDNGNSINNIKKEIEKCVVLCSNCHRKEHYKNNNL